MRILYVEDNMPNVMLVQRVARMGRHDVINYPEGEQAINRFEQDKPDLVLMDIQLQGKLNGLEVVKTLRDKGFATPIIALTAYAMGGDRQRCLEAGCDDYIPKPVSVNELVTIFSHYQEQTAAPPKKDEGEALITKSPAIEAPAAAPVNDPPATENKFEPPLSPAESSSNGTASPPETI
ncbi:MAG: response regulator [Anaerolineae bacterium]